MAKGLNLITLFKSCIFTYLNFMIHSTSRNSPNRSPRILYSFTVVLNHYFPFTLNILKQPWISMWSINIQLHTSKDMRANIGIACLHIKKYIGSSDGLLPSTGALVLCNLWVDVCFYISNKHVSFNRHTLVRLLLSTHEKMGCFFGHVRLEHR